MIITIKDMLNTPIRLVKDSSEDKPEEKETDLYKFGFDVFLKDKELTYNTTNGATKEKAEEHRATIQDQLTKGMSGEQDIVTLGPNLIFKADDLQGFFVKSLEKV